ncbi:MAG: 50S ribosomal protein L1 [Candidatus Omnitrophica bacterium]|jgi:large subunit ribosomal protein L1|nr:50S ribosomal protein L1 [Candidatus Omnitrophota bacterium]MDD3275046.1 50S ribosomal protein L1 [Candidatus Omnitrophota bacterium]MDD5078681.1 50S ribosomal protein L1 [Candidatus Omnitrophota bacterium]
MKKPSKRYKESDKQLTPDKMYSLKEAVAALKTMPKPKFDGSVDLHFNLNVDTKKSDQMIRGTVVLPHGTGKKIRVAVFCKGEHERQAREAKADYVGANELMDKVAAGFLDFDCAIATPEMMKDLSKLGKVLGPRGLMPSPKTGTVTNDISKAIEDVRKGKVEFRVDKQGGIHLSVGKISFEEEKINDNASKVIEAVNESRPVSVKGKFVKSLSITTSMNPGLRIVC